MPTTNHSRESAADSVTRSQLRFLLDLLASGKLSRTASHLGLSLSAASRTLDRLREAFGDPLFTPHARGLTPTDTMLQIEPELRRTIAQTDRLFSLRTLDLSRLERTFSMSAWGIVVPEMLAYLLPRMASEAPGAHLEMRHRSLKIWEMLETGELDLIFTPDSAVPPSFRTLPLFPVELGILLRADHPLVRECRGEAPSMERFLDYKRFGMTVSTDLHAASWDRQLFGEDPKVLAQVVCSSKNGNDLMDVLECTDFMMLAPKRGALSLQPRYNLVWLPLPEGLPKPRAGHIVLAWCEARQRDPAHQWLRGLIRDWARESEAEFPKKEALMRSLMEKNFD